MNNNKEQQNVKEFNSMEKMKELTEKFKNEIELIKKELEKEEEVVSLVILPPHPEHQDTLFLSTFLDDINIKGEKLIRINQLMNKIKKLNDRYKNININVKTITEVWNEFNEGNWENYNPIVPSIILIDKHYIIEAIKIGFIHRDLIKKQFDKYIMSYVLFGSVAKLQTNKDSDIDFAIIVDDTDLKEMSRYQAREQLLQIFYSLVMEAKKISGVNREIHLQVYLLTDIWENLKEANPVIVNFIRDAVVFYDNGVIIPWKRLLENGKIKPTPESIDNYFKLGEELENVVFNKLRNLVMEDIFWATITPTQAVIMALGYEPPYPKLLPEFVKNIKEKEKVFSDEDVLFLEEIIKYRKGLEHGTIKELDGKKVDELKEKALKFFSKMKRLYRNIIFKYRKRELITLYKRIKQLLSLLYNIESVSLIAPLIEKGKISFEVKDYLPYIEEFENSNIINDYNAEILWKAFKIIYRDLETEFERAKKEKINKLILKGRKDGKEYIVLILKDAIGLSEDGKIVKLYKDNKVEEVPFNLIFEEILKYAENLEEVNIDLKKLKDLDIELIF